MAVRSKGTLEARLGVRENRLDLLIPRPKPGARGPLQHPTAVAEHTQGSALLSSWAQRPF